MLAERTATRMTAEDVLFEHWDGILPIDPKRVAESLGMEVREFSDDVRLGAFPGVDPHPDAGLSGKFCFDDGLPVCYFNPGDPLVRQRFTIAHEIGHYVLDHGDSFRDPSANFSTRGNNYKEVEANRFAARLLMPKPIVLKSVREEGITDLVELANKFFVSQVAMEYRLKNLGLIP